MKKIVVLGAGIYNIQVYEKLVNAGFYTIAMDGNNNAPAAKYASEFVHLDFTKKEDVLTFCIQNKIDGILPINDWGTKTAAFISEKMQLPGISENAALLSTDKGLMRDAWKKNNCLVPNYFVFSNINELQNNINNIGFPCVIKPTDSGGSGRGISVLHNVDDIKWAFEFAKPYVKNNRFICEQFIEGIELTIETISIENEVHVLAISDKEKPNLKTRVATSLNYPANISEKLLQKVKEIVSKAVLSLEITTGMAHTEMIYTPNEELFLVETGARGGGGHIFHTIIEQVSGINIVCECAKLLCGEKITLPTILKRGSVYRFFNPPHGILKAINNWEIAKNIPGILDIGMIKKIGEEVGNLENSLQRAGHVITGGKDRTEAVSIADEVENTLDFVVE